MLKMMNNHVLVKIDDRPDHHYNSKNEPFLHAEHIIEHYQYNYTSGTVLAVPEFITTAYDFETEVEVKVGDQIIFDYLAIQRDHQDSSKIIHHKKIGDDFIIGYKDIFCAVRDGRVIPVNGWCILEGEMENKVESETIIIPEELQKKLSQTICTIKYIGTPIAYRHGIYKGEDPEDDSWYVGQKVAIPKHKALPLQKEDFALIHTGKLLYRARRKDMVDMNWIEAVTKLWAQTNPESSDVDSRATSKAFLAFEKELRDKAEKKEKVVFRIIQQRDGHSSYRGNKR